MRFRSETGCRNFNDIHRVWGLCSDVGNNVGKNTTGGGGGPVLVHEGENPNLYLGGLIASLIGKCHPRIRERGTPQFRGAWRHDGEFPANEKGSRRRQGVTVSPNRRGVKKIGNGEIASDWCVNSHIFRGPLNHN